MGDNMADTLSKIKLETPITSKYLKYHITSFDEIKKWFDIDKPLLTVIDSETTGLHIKKDKPFMWVFGWRIPECIAIKGRVFSFNHDTELLHKVLELSKSTTLIGHNIKYDLHMAINGGVNEQFIYSFSHITDTMGLCRLSFNSVSVRDGGDSLALKEVTKKYIDKNADLFEKSVKQELRNINDIKRKILLKQLKELGWSVGKLKDAYKIKSRNGIEVFTFERNQRWIEVPEEVQKVYSNWIKNYPLATYAEVSDDVIKEYIHSDVIYTLEVFERQYPIVKARQQFKILKQENRLLIDLLKMERVGLKVDMNYLKDSFNKCESEINKLYKELWELIGQKITVAQSKVIADYYKTLGVETETTDKKFLNNQNNRVAQIITRLRRLEKWQSTYISRIIEVAEYDGRFYTTYNQFNTISGRLGSDSQQFPKERILTEQGEKYELEHGLGKALDKHIIFSPRQAFTVDDNDYNRIVYFDLSQIELRVQANYTILLDKPNKNLCRAYMPYQCRHYLTGEDYIYTDEFNRNRWNEKDSEGNSVWVTEDDKRWTPTDVHSETAHNCLLALDYRCKEKYKLYTHYRDASVDEKSFKKFWRYIGKMFNFMRNYGGGSAKAAEALEIEMYIADALVEGWSKTFPEVANYQNKVTYLMNRQGYVTNMLGRSYYLTNKDRSYKVANYLVQGSCSDRFKDYIIEINDFFLLNNCKSRIVMNIHDEIQISLYKEEEWIIPEIKKIMEVVKWSKVPIVVDVEVTDTTWANKKEYN